MGTNINDKLDGFFAEANKPNHSPEQVKAIIAAIKPGIETWLSESATERLNALFKQRSRRAVTIDDVALIMGVHLSSIVTREGQSPVTRIEGFSREHGKTVDRCHIGLITEMLVAVGALKIEKKSNAFRHKATVYSIPNRLREVVENASKSGFHTHDSNECNEEK